MIVLFYPITCILVLSSADWRDELDKLDSFQSSGRIEQKWSDPVGQGAGGQPYYGYKEEGIGLLKIHNDARKKYNHGNMVWNEELALDAALWAYQMAKDAAKQGCDGWHMKHDMTGKRVGGENIGGGSWDYAAKQWLAEGNGYQWEQYGSGKNGDKVVGHYTQMIWKGSKELGCGEGWCYPPGEGRYLYVVCRYYLAGNTRGHYPSYVKPNADTFAEAKAKKANVITTLPLFEILIAALVINVVLTVVVYGVNGVRQTKHGKQASFTEMEVV